MASIRDWVSSVSASTIDSASIKVGCSSPTLSIASIARSGNSRNSSNRGSAPINATMLLCLGSTLSQSLSMNFHRASNCPVVSHSICKSWTHSLGGISAARADSQSPAARSTRFRSGALSCIPRGLYCSTAGRCPRLTVRTKYSVNPLAHRRLRGRSASARSFPSQNKIAAQANLLQPSLPGLVDRASAVRSPERAGQASVIAHSSQPPRSVSLAQ